MNTPFKFSNKLDELYRSLETTTEDCDFREVSISCTGEVDWYWDQAILRFFVEGAFHLSHFQEIKNTVERFLEAEGGHLVRIKILAGAMTVLQISISIPKEAML